MKSSAVCGGRHDSPGTEGCRKIQLCSSWSSSAGGRNRRGAVAVWDFPYPHLLLTSLQPHGIRPQDESCWCTEMCLPPRLGKGVIAGRETWEFQMDFWVWMQFLCLISTSVFAIKTRESLVWQCYRWLYSKLGWSRLYYSIPKPLTVALTECWRVESLLGFLRHVLS